MLFLITLIVLMHCFCGFFAGAPQGVDFEQVQSLLTSLDSVVAVHNLNVWSLTMDRNALSVHLAIG